MGEDLKPKANTVFDFLKLKPARAREHLHVLQREIDAFYESEPYTVTRRDQPEHARHIIRVQIADPPHRIALVAGDAVHNLRSALDHLVYALARTAGHTPNVKRVQFPILSKRDKATLDRQTQGIPDEARSIIEGLQPYHMDKPAQAALWQLHCLDIIDKHRHIPFRAHAAELKFSGASLSRDDVHGEPLDDGYMMDIPLAAAGVKVNFQPAPAVGIVFGDEESAIALNIESLTAIHRLIVDGILPAFTRFFA